MDWTFIWAPLGKELELFYQNSPVAAIMQMSAEKTAVGVRMNLSIAIDAFKYLKKGEERFSITNWIQQEDQDSWLFLTALPTSGLL